MLFSQAVGALCSFLEEDVKEKKINIEQVQSSVWKDFRNLHLYVVFSKMGGTIELVSKSEEEAEVQRNQ